MICLLTFRKKSISNFNIELVLRERDIWSHLNHDYRPTNAHSLKWSWRTPSIRCSRRSCDAFGVRAQQKWSLISAFAFRFRLNSLFVQLFQWKFMRKSVAILNHLTCYCPSWLPMIIPWDRKQLQLPLAVAIMYIDRCWLLNCVEFMLCAILDAVNQQLHSIWSPIKLCATKSNNKISSTWLPWLRALEVKYFTTTDDGTNENVMNVTYPNVNNIIIFFYAQFSVQGRDCGGQHMRIIAHASFVSATRQSHTHTTT